jgi:hypothetical protein
MSSTFRRNHRSEDIVAQRRLRGEIACAECRRYVCLQPEKMIRPLQHQVEDEV